MGTHGHLQKAVKDDFYASIAIWTKSYCPVSNHIYEIHFYSIVSKLWHIPVKKCGLRRWICNERAYSLIGPSRCQSLKGFAGFNVGSSCKNCSSNFTEAFNLLRLHLWEVEIARTCMYMATIRTSFAKTRRCQYSQMRARGDRIKLNNTAVWMDEGYEYLYNWSRGNLQRC